MGRPVFRRTSVAAAACAAALLGSWALCAPSARAIAPPQPATCAFNLADSVTTLGAAGTLALSIQTTPAVAYQECSVSVSVTSTIADLSGTAASGVTSNPISQDFTLSFAPNRVPDAISVLWAGYCTTDGGPAELITQVGNQQSVAPLGVQEPCDEKGTGSSFLEPFQELPPSDVSITPSVGGLGYREVANDGVISQEGTPQLNLPNPAQSQVWPSTAGPAVAIAATPSGDGDWVASADGDVFDYGSAPSYGSAAGVHLNAPIVGMAVDPATGGYWLVGADGGVFSFNAPFYGSTGSLRLNAPIVGIAAAPNGQGYWLVAADGGVFSFGHVAFDGSAGSIRLNSPVVGIAANPTGGYWLVAADGGVFSFGAPFYGSAGSVHLNAGVSGIAAVPGGGGYWLVAADGGVFTYGDARFYGAPLTNVYGFPLSA